MLVLLVTLLVVPENLGLSSLVRDSRESTMSTLSLAKNGYVFSSKQTKNIKATYFFVHHFHTTGELDLLYCSTEQMWADVLNKPLGAKLGLMQAFLMNSLIDYHKNQLFTPTADPTLTPVWPTIKNTTRAFIPSNEPTDLLMKPRFFQNNPSSQGCVETKSHGTVVPPHSRMPMSQKYKPTKRNVTWRDPMVFPYCLPHSPSPGSLIFNRIWCMA